MPRFGYSRPREELRTDTVRSNVIARYRNASAAWEVQSCMGLGLGSGCSNRLASPAMGDDGGEALLTPMKCAELRSRAIIEILASHSCLHWSARMVSVSRMVQHDAPHALLQPARTVSVRRSAPLI